jgi:3-phosphoglycerate kinase
VFIPQREVETLADALHELVVERRNESVALLENLSWGDKQAEGEWSDRANLTRSLTSLRDAIILQGKIERGHRV